MAKLYPDVLIVGVDANADNLREASRRVSLKPAKGGAPNAIFGRLSLEDAPGELVGLADALTVFFPWGSLLEAVARPEPRALRRLHALGKPNCRVQIVFGYDRSTDLAWMNNRALPPLDQPATLGVLERQYRNAGFDASVTRLTLAQVRDLRTAWAKKLSFGGGQRPFVEVQGSTLL